MASATATTATATATAATTTATTTTPDHWDAGVYAKSKTVQNGYVAHVMALFTKVS